LKLLSNLYFSPNSEMD